VKFGTCLKHLRQPSKLTQGELACKFGLSDADLGSVEAAEAEHPTRQVCKVLVCALRVGRNKLWRYAFTARRERWLDTEGIGNRFVPTCGSQHLPLALGAGKPAKVTQESSKPQQSESSACPT